MLELLSFKGKLGWEFMDFLKFDLVLFFVVVVGEGDAEVVDRVEMLFEAFEGAIMFG